MSSSAKPWTINRIVHEFPETSNIRVSLGSTYCNFGHLVALGQGRPADSLTWFDQAMRTLQPVVERDPRMAVPRQILRNAHAGRAWPAIDWNNTPTRSPAGTA